MILKFVYILIPIEHNFELDCYSFSGTFTSELPECTQDLMIDVTRSYYQHFKPVAPGKWTYSIISTDIKLVILYLLFMMEEGLQSNLLLLFQALFICILSISEEVGIDTLVLSFNFLYCSVYGPLSVSFGSMRGGPYNCYGPFGVWQNCNFVKSICGELRLVLVIDKSWNISHFWQWETCIYFCLFFGLELPLARGH